jgi:hypothetical protein
MKIYTSSPVLVGLTQQGLSTFVKYLVKDAKSRRDCIKGLGGTVPAEKLDKIKIELNFRDDGRVETTFGELHRAFSGCDFMNETDERGIEILEN